MKYSYLCTRGNTTIIMPRDQIGLASRRRGSSTFLVEGHYYCIPEGNKRFYVTHFEEEAKVYLMQPTEFDKIKKKKSSHKNKVVPIFNRIGVTPDIFGKRHKNSQKRVRIPSPHFPQRPFFSLFAPFSTFFRLDKGRGS